MLHQYKGKSTMPKKRKQKWITWAKIGGGITILSAILASLSDAFDLKDRFFGQLSPTQATQAVAVASDDLVLMTFPWYVGNTWEYSFGTRTNASQDQPETNETGKYTAKVVNVETLYGGEGRVFYMEVSPPASNYAGFIFNAPCGSQDDSKITFIILTDGKSIYEECDRMKLVDLANRLFSDPENPPAGAVYMLPLVEGAYWPYYSDVQSQDITFWNWYVEPAQDISVPAGTFKNCYKISFRTNPDITTHFVCPGVGLVASEYHHFGSIVDFRAELTAYNLINTP
jgi:hypothetical protein